VQLLMRHDAVCIQLLLKLTHTCKAPVIGTQSFVLPGAQALQHKPAHTALTRHAVPAAPAPSQLGSGPWLVDNVNDHSHSGPAKADKLADGVTEIETFCSQRYREGR
jgi:hypothetical protein